MKITKSMIIKYVVITATFMLSLLAIYVSDEIYVHIGSIVLLGAVAVTQVKFDLLHPYFWFSGFFCLYSIAYPLMRANGYGSVSYTKEVMVLQLVALFTLLVVVTPESHLKLEQIDTTKFQDGIGILNKLIYALLLAVLALATFYVIRGGFGGKSEIYASGNPILTFAFRCPLILTLVYAMSVVSNYIKQRKLPVKEMLISTVALLLITLFSGERDFVFRFLLVNIFILWLFRLLKLKHLFVLVPLLILLIPLSHVYKYYFVGGGMHGQGSDSLLYSLLSGEFESASRNLQILINDGAQTNGMMGFFLLLKEIASSVIPGIQSTQSWFNERYFPGRSVQYGFSLVGDGYLMGGIPGIILVFVLIGLLIRWFYRNSTKNLYWLASYFYFATVIIYSIRGDFSTILAAIVKQIGLVVLILYIAKRMSKRKI